jgi:uncharacterized protein YndB with AHSA1/START domain
MMRDARVELSARGLPVLHFDRQLTRPPAAVWRALTDREELKAWFPCDIITEGWKVGASLRFVFRGGEWHDLDGTVLEYDEPHVLAFTWGDETLRFELSESEGGTRLLFTDELDPSIAARNAAGWDVCLELLESGQTDDDLWKVRFDHYVAAFAPALGDQVGPPSTP